MSNAHTFQTPIVEPCLPAQEVVLHLSVADAVRVVRALDETSLNLAVAPGGSRLATTYRRLAADVRAQTRNV
jgi:hypothetical protein